VLFRLALSAAALLVIFVLAREVWRPRPEARSPAVVTPPPPRAPSPPLPVEAVAPRLEPTLVEEPAVAPSEPAAPAETPSEPRVIAAAPPPAVHAEPERRPAAPAPRPLPPPWEEGPQPAGLLRPGPGVEEPVPLELPRYRYPPEAQGTGLRADVRLALLVDERGRVIAARVREGAPLGLGFAETALSVAERIPFQPATRHRVPGKMWTELILEFIE
jgi:TonB family protein